LASAFFLSSKAQTYLPGATLSFAQWQPFHPYRLLSDSSPLNSKWQLSTYSGVSAGVGFYGGYSTTYMSVPVGLQLSRPLNNNLVAFAGVSAAPVFYTFPHAFMNPAYNKSYPGNYLPNTYQFGMDARAELGLMYMNDARTFSISGSIGVERSSYPIYPVDNRVNTKRQPANAR
jgi:hypothetical protein